MTNYQRLAARRAAGRRFDRDDRERRRLAELPPAMASPEVLPDLDATESAEAAEAEARRIARLPWWERMSPEERAERDATIARSKYLSC